MSTGTSSRRRRHHPLPRVRPVNRHCPLNTSMCARTLRMPKRNSTLATDFTSHQDEIPGEGGQEEEPAPYEEDTENTALDHESQPSDEFGDLTEAGRPNGESFHVYDEYIDVLEDPDIDVDDFVDGLHRPPTLPTTATGQRVARRKAIQILDAIQPLPQRERADALAYLADLFEHLPHPATIQRHRAAVTTAQH